MSRFIIFVKFVAAVCMIYFALMVAIFIVTPRSDGPPDGNQGYQTFESDQAMVAHCGCLSFDTTGLSVERASRDFYFEGNGYDEKEKWEGLRVGYSVSEEKDATSADWDRFSMLVYFEELESTDSFPAENLEIQGCTINNIPVQYQRHKEEGYAFCALFLYDGYTYQVTVSSPDHPEILLEYLPRLIPTE